MFHCLVCMHTIYHICHQAPNTSSPPSKFPTSVKKPLVSLNEIYSQIIRYTRHLIKIKDLLNTWLIYSPIRQCFYLLTINWPTTGSRTRTKDPSQRIDYHQLNLSNWRGHIAHACQKTCFFGRNNFDPLPPQMYTIICGQPWFESSASFLIILPPNIWINCSGTFQICITKPLKSNQFFVLDRLICASFFLIEILKKNSC